jgi:hypothetical protein
MIRNVNHVWLDRKAFFNLLALQIGQMIVARGLETHVSLAEIMQELRTRITHVSDAVWKDAILSVRCYLDDVEAELKT